MKPKGERMKKIFAILFMVTFFTVAACAANSQSSSTSSFDINLTPATPTESVIDLIIPRQKDMPQPDIYSGGLFGSAKNDEFGVPKSFLPVPIQVGTESINTYNSGDQDCSVAKSAEGFVMTTPSSTTTVKLIRRDEIGLSVKYPVVEFNQGYSGDQYDGAWFVFRSELIQNRYVVSLQCYRQGLLLAEGNINTSPGMLIGMSGTINPNYSIYIEY
jgi:hypothetical protein